MLRHQPKAFTRLRRATYFLLRGQEKSRQREGHPHARALRTVPVLQVRESAPGFADSTSMCWQQTGPHPVGHPSDFSCAASPRATGPIQRASCAPKQKQDPKPMTRPKRAKFCIVFALSLLRGKRSEWGPFVAAVRRRESPQGGSQGCEPVGCQARDGLSVNLRSRAAKSQGRMPGDRCIGVAFLWVTFLWPRKER